MEAKEAVWLSTDKLKKKYAGIFLEEGWTMPFIGMLVSAFLLRGRKQGRKLEILEESWLILIKHTYQNLRLKASYFGHELDNHKFSVAEYEGRPLLIQHFTDPGDWVTVDDLLLDYPGLKEQEIFSSSFIGMLIGKNILRGRFSHSALSNMVLKPSFKWLLEYRNANIDSWKVDLRAEINGKPPEEE